MHTPDGCAESLSLNAFKIKNGVIFISTTAHIYVEYRTASKEVDYNTGITLQFVCERHFSPRLTKSENVPALFF